MLLYHWFISYFVHFTNIQNSVYCLKMGPVCDPGLENPPIVTDVSTVLYNL